MRTTGFHTVNKVEVCVGKQIWQPTAKLIKSHSLQELADMTAGTLGKAGSWK